MGTARKKIAKIAMKLAMKCLLLTKEISFIASSGFLLKERANLTRKILIFSNQLLDES
jgi:hypothetical protein